MNLNTFLLKLNNTPDQIEFNDTLSVIESLYDFTQVEFKNGDLTNAAGQNNGSCKLFAFAQLQHFTVDKTLACFGAYYREDVLKNPEGTDHQNIRNFMQHGWHGIQYQDEPLTPKQIG
jgi:hypothetical protein